MKPGWLIVFVVFVVAAAFGAAQVPTFAVKTEEVRIDVLVSVGGKPVRGLSASDFEVFDDGVLQQVDFASFEQAPINAILALDMSESVAGDRLDQLKNAGRLLLDRLQKDDRAALVTFSHIVTIASMLTADPERVKTALGHAQPFGDTSLIDASFTGLVMSPSDSGRSLLILFTDGLDTASWLTPDAVLNTAKRSETVVYTIAAGHLPNTTFLRNLSAYTGGMHFDVESSKDLSTVFLNIFDEFRERYLLYYSPRGVSKIGWHQLEVRVKGKSVTIRARPGYLIGP